MDNEIFESSEFYQLRYNNFSIKIIMPIFILTISFIAVLFIVPKTIKIQTQGVFIPSKNEIPIEISDSKEIKTKFPKDRVQINEGETLLTYETGETITSPVDGDIYIDDENNQVIILPRDKNKIFIKAYVTQEEISHIEIGQEVSIQYNKELLNGVVNNVSKVVTFVDNEPLFEVIIKSNTSKNYPFYAMSNIFIKVDQKTYAKYIYNQLF